MTTRDHTLDFGRHVVLAEIERALAEHNFVDRTAALMSLDRIRNAFGLPADPRLDSILRELSDRIAKKACSHVPRSHNRRHARSA